MQTKPSVSRIWYSQENQPYLAHRLAVVWIGQEYRSVAPDKAVVDGSKLEASVDEGRGAGQHVGLVVAEAAFLIGSLVVNELRQQVSQIEYIQEIYH